MAGLLGVAGEALDRGPWSVRGSSGSASGRSNRIKGQVKRSINRGVFVMTPRAHGNRVFIAGERHRSAIWWQTLANSAGLKGIPCFYWLKLAGLNSQLL